MFHWFWMILKLFWKLLLRVGCLVLFEKIWDFWPQRWNVKSWRFCKPPQKPTMVRGKSSAIAFVLSMACPHDDSVPPEEHVMLGDGWGWPNSSSPWWTFAAWPLKEILVVQSSMLTCLCFKHLQFKNSLRVMRLIYQLLGGFEHFKFPQY